MIQHQQYNNIAQFNQTIFTAVAEQQPLEEVQTITMKGEFTRLVEQQAMSNLVRNKKCLSTKAMLNEINRIFKDNLIHVQESVTVDRDGVSVVVDAIRMEDDTTIMRVFRLISQALDQLDGHYGTINFGDPVTFTKQDIPWLTLH